MKRALRSFVLAVGMAYRADPLRAVGAFLVTGLSGVAMASFAVWVRLMADGAVEADLARASWGAAGAASAIAITIVASWVSFTLNVGLHERTARLIDDRLIELSSSAPGLEHHERPDYIRELELLREHRIELAQTSWSLAEGLGIIVRAGVTFTLLAMVDPLLLTLPLFAVPSMLATSRAQRLWHRSEEEMAETNRSVDHLFDLATKPEPGKELRIFRLEDEIRRRFLDGRAALERAYVRAQLRGAVYSAAGWTVFAAGYVGAITLVVTRAASGTVTPGEVAQTLILAGQVNQQASGVISIVGWLFETLKAMGRFIWLADHVKEQMSALRPPDPAPVPTSIRRGIDIRDLSFRYPGADADVLTDVTLHIPAGATVAIVGDNGVGKSTLVKLLARFYEPSRGSIELDGVDIRRFAPEAWRERLSAAFQDHMRFELLAREVVGVGALDQVDDLGAVSIALDRADAADVVASLPGGLATQLGKSFPDGRELSGGQWQKLALGRAMMRADPLLLMLDEPTASLDAQAEHALFERYAGVARDAARRTGAITVLVSHRFSTVRMADLIVVVDQGRVSEAGSHDELMRRRGLYAELFELQARAYR